jgi:hypothetical protein
MHKNVISFFAGVQSIFPKTYSWTKQCKSKHVCLYQTLKATLLYLPMQVAWNLISDGGIKPIIG